MIISKEQFVKIIQRLRDYNDLQDKIQDLFRENIDNQEMDFINAGSICIGHETIVVDLLGYIFNDRDTISWWLYECNYGRKRDMTYIIEADDTWIDLSTPEKLYDYLVKEMENK